MTTDLETQLTLADIELEPILYVDAHMTLTQAAERLDQGYGALVLTHPLRCVRARDVVRALGSGQTSDTAVCACQLDRPIVLADTTLAETALTVLLDQPERCVVVVDRAHDGIGRLTLSALMQSLTRHALWKAALRTTGRPEEPFLLEVEP